MRFEAMSSRFYSAMQTHMMTMISVQRGGIVEEGLKILMQRDRGEQFLETS